MDNAVNDQIYDWLDEKLNYSVGVSLFSQVCKNRSLLNTLLRSQTKYNSDKLVYELDKYLKSIDYAKQPTKKAQTSRSIQKQSNDTRTVSKSVNSPIKKGAKLDDSVVHIPNPSGDSSFLSGPVRLKRDQLLKDRNDCYAKRDFFHAQLSVVPTPDGRLSLAINIEDLRLQIDQFNDQISKMEDKNTIPLELQDKNVWFKLQKQITNVKSYINRYKNKEKEAKTIKERDKSTKYLDKYEKRLILLTKQAETE